MERERKRRGKREGEGESGRKRERVVSRESTVNVAAVPVSATDIPIKASSLSQLSQKRSSFVMLGLFFIAYHYLFHQFNVTMARGIKVFTSSSLTRFSCQDINALTKTKM
eukprot:sb/3477337/